MAQAGRHTADRIADMGNAMGTGLADAASDLAAKAGDKLESVADQASSTARSIAAQGRDAGERVQAVAGNVRGAVDKSLIEQPMTTLALAAGVGFVLGALWRS